MSQVTHEILSENLLGLTFPLHQIKNCELLCNVSILVTLFSGIMVLWKFPTGTLD